MAEYLGLVELGALYYNSVAQARPLRPWRPDAEPVTGIGIGDLLRFGIDPVTSKYTLGDTPTDTTKRLRWHKIKDGAKTLLVCDRNILCDISWDDLNAMGFVTGKNIVIDGVTYLCRLLTGGSNYRGSDAYSGGTPLDNEWDRFITREDSTLTGLAVPSTNDLDSNILTNDQTSAHNILWNWFCVYSWCQEVYTGNSAYRSMRGCGSARYYGWGTSSTRNVHRGWRPVLEILNSAPQISDTDRNLGDKATSFNINYQVSDADSADVLTVTEKIDTKLIRTISPAQKAFQYTINVDVDSLALGTHTVTIEVADNKGAKSTRTFTFTKTNTAPTISGTDTNLGDKNIGFSVKYQVNDVDGDALTVTEKLNGVVLRTHNNPPKLQDITISLDNATIYGLPLLSSNTITIEVKDTKGGIAYRTYTFRRVNTAPQITGSNENLGLIAAPFTRNYIITDAEGDDVVVREKINDVEIRSFKVTLGSSNTISLPLHEWIKLPNGTHTLTVEAQDINTAMTVRTFTFQKNDNKIKISLKNPFKTTIAATKILVTPSWKIEGATVKVEACNNANDELPTWEDITAQVLQNRHYNFTNATKTALEWGIGIRVTVEKNPGVTEEVSIRGLGGAFE